MDVTPDMLEAQQEMLREIRDELRQGRMQAMGGHGGFSGASTKPGGSFATAQAATDRVLAGDWAGLGWSAAYTNVYRSSFSSDILASMGFMRSPSNMTQPEFQSIAGQTLAARLSGGAMSIFAPTFASRSSDLASEIFRNSGRFIRAGNEQAGIFGSGFDFSSATGLARDIQQMAIRDPRLSGGDYNTIASLGMQSGQFDFTSSTEDFKRKVKELADATASLSRTMHMSVQEVASAMGNLRMFGMSNVSDQQRFLTGARASAGVAGMTSGEMVAVGLGGMSAGLGMGLGGSGGADLAMGNMASVRAMSQGGIISPTLMALGGGAVAMQQSMTNAQLGFGASQMGMLMMRGGGGNAFGALTRGLGGINSFDALMQFQSDRVGFSPSGDQLSGTYRSYIDTMLGQFGVSDQTSGRAQNLAFMLTRGSMGDAAARAFALANYSAQGRRSSADTEREQAYQFERTRRMDAADISFSRTSLTGAVRGTIADIGAAGAGLYRRAAEAFTPGFGAQVDAYDKRVGLGITATGINSDDLLAMGHTGRAMPTSVALGGSQGGMATALTLGGTAAGAVAGAYFGSPTIGATLGGIAGRFAGRALGANEIVLEGAQAADYTNFSDLVSRAGPSTNENLMRRIMGSGARAGFMQMLKQDMSSMGGAESMEFRHRISDLRRMAGNTITEGEFIAAAKGMNIPIAMDKAVERFGNSPRSQVLQDVFAPKLGGWRSWVTHGAAATVGAIGLAGSGLLLGVGGLGAATAAGSIGAAYATDKFVGGMLGDRVNVDAGSLIERHSGDLAAVLSGEGSMSGINARRALNGEYGAATVNKMLDRIHGMAEGDRAALVGTLNQAHDRSIDVKENLLMSSVYDIGMSRLDRMASASGGSETSQMRAARAALGATSSDRRQLLSVITGNSDVRALASQGMLGATYQTIAGIDSTQGLMQASSSSIEKRFNIDHDFLERARKAAGGDEQLFKRNLERYVAAGRGGSEAKAEEADTAGRLADAARDLARATENLAKVSA